MLDVQPPPRILSPRDVDTVITELRTLAAVGDLDLPLPGGGHTAARWAALARLGRRDLALARLAEGHTDAVAILAEAGRKPVPDALYGVWAARSSGTGPPDMARPNASATSFAAASAAAKNSSSFER